MRIVTLIILFVSFNLYSQEIEYQLYLKNSCNDSIEKSVFYSLKKENKEYNIENLDNPFVKVPNAGFYELISEETNEIYKVEITIENSKDTLLFPSIYGKVKPLSFKKNNIKSGIRKLNREESRIVYGRCNSLLNGEEKEYFTNGNLRFEGNFINGYAVGEIKEYYQNGNIKIISIFDGDGFLTKEINYDKNGTEIKK